MVANAAQCASRTGRISVFVLLLLAGGCQVPSRNEHATPTQAPATPAAAPQTVSKDGGGVAWPVDPERTLVTIIVRRAGPLARLGHDHVINSADETGTVWMGATPAQTRFELTLPVERLEVDLPGSRATAGAEFAAPVPEDARAGTRRNMLRAEVLDAATHPSISLRSVAASGDWSQPVVRVAIELRGTTREFEVPVVVQRDPRSIVARGELRFNQSDFGITPFSVAGGAIQVADAIEVRFEIAARAP